MSDYRTILRQGLIYGLSSVATKALSVVLFPLFSRFLSVAEYGVLVRVEILWQFLFVIINFGTTIAVFNELHQAQSEEARAHVLSTMMTWYIAIGGVLVLSLYGVQHVLASFLLGSAEYGPLIALAGSIALLEMMLFVPLLELRERERPWSYVGLTSVSLLLSAAGQVAALFLYTDPLIMVYLLRLGGPIVAILVSTRVVAMLFRFRLDRAILRRVLSYSFPVLASALMALGLSGIDRYILGIMRTDHEVGLYGLGYNVGGLLNLFAISPLLMVVHALMWKKMSEPDGSQFFSRLMTHAVAMLGFFAVGVSLFGYSLIRAFALNADYWSAAAYVPLLTFGYVFFGMANIGMLSFYLGHRTHLMIGVYAVAIAVNVMLNILLIPSQGAVGASIAAVSGNVVLFAMTTRLSRRAFHISYEWRTVSLLLLATAVWIVAGQYVQFQNGIVEAFARLAWCALFPAILGLAGIYGRSEWASFLSSIRENLSSMKSTNGQ